MPSTGAIVGGHFTGDGVDIPYNTLRAAKARRAEEES
jgi:hypothetical protein